MDRTDAAQSPLEWFEEAKEIIDAKSKEIPAETLKYTEQALASLFDLFKANIKESVKESLTDYIVAAVQTRLDVLKGEMISQSKTEVYGWAVQEILNEANELFESSIDSAVEAANTSIKNTVDMYINFAVQQRVTAVTSSIKSELSSYMNTLNNLVKTYIPEYSVATISTCGDVVNKSKADKLKLAGYRLRKIGSQGATPDVNKKEALELVGTGELIADGAEVSFGDDIAEFEIVPVLSTLTSPHASASVPLYHVGTKSSFSARVYQVVYEKYDAGTGKIYYVQYWRTNLSSATLTAEYRGIEEYVVI